MLGHIIQRLTRLRLRIRYRLDGSDLVLVISALIIMIAIGTAGYAILEGWEFIDALYATVITVTTVGYGDITPDSLGGRLFAIAFTLTAIGITGYALSALAAVAIERQSLLIENRLRKRRMKRLDALEDHMIVLGAGLMGRHIAKEFYDINLPFVVIDNDEQRLKETLLFLQPDYFQSLIANYIEIKKVDTEQYERMSLPELSAMLNVDYIVNVPTDEQSLLNVGIERARGMVAALPDERDNLTIVVGARALVNQLDVKNFRIMASVTEEQFVRKLYLAGADSVRVVSEVTGFMMASHVLHPDLGEWWYKIRQGDNQMRFRDFRVAEFSEFVGKTTEHLREQYRVQVLTIQRNGEEINLPAPDTTIHADDILIGLGMFER